MNIILFNGPPSCGKDTAAKFIFRNFPHTHFDRLSMPIKRAFAGAFNSPINEFGEVFGWESIKDEPHWLLNFKSYREWQIDFSEKFMKPLYGANIFPLLFEQRTFQLQANTIVVPDCGFEVEVETLVEKMGRNNHIFLIRIYRPGYDFRKDSRNYVLGRSLMPDRIFDIDNAGTENDFELTIARLREKL